MLYTICCLLLIILFNYRKDLVKVCATYSKFHEFWQHDKSVNSEVWHSYYMLMSVMGAFTITCFMKNILNYYSSSSSLSGFIGIFV